MQTIYDRSTNFMLYDILHTLYCYESSSDETIASRFDQTLDKMDVIKHVFPTSFMIYSMGTAPIIAKPAKSSNKR